MICDRIDWFGCSSFISRGVLFITRMLYLADFNLVACDFVRFYLIVILKQNVNFSFNIWSLNLLWVSFIKTQYDFHGLMFYLYKLTKSLQKVSCKTKCRSQLNLTFFSVSRFNEMCFCLNCLMSTLKILAFCSCCLFN